MLSRYKKLLGFSTSLVLAFTLATVHAQPGENPSTSIDSDSPVRAGLVSSLSDIEFAPLVLGQQATHRFVLTNTGMGVGKPITVFSIYLDEQDSLSFSTDFDGPATVKSGESIAIDVMFSPNRAGAIEGTLMISHDGDSGLEIFTLSGTGIDSADNASLTPLSRAVDMSAVSRAAPSKISFGKSILQGIGTITPTSLQFGPDGKLYVADMLGLVKVYSVKRNKANSYSVTKTDTITKIRDIPNHNDNGARNTSIRNRLVTGLLVLGTADDPVIYVNSSDPRIGGGPSHKDTNLDTNSSIISRLRKVGSQWVKQDLVRGLPRSEENHHLNGMAYNPVKNHLYVAAGGNTNQGGASQNFAKLPEFALSAAILEIDLNQIGNSTYDLPTLDDQTRAGVRDNNDPFGGNNGLNQAKLVPGGPVQIYAPGFRNAYDVVVTTSGNMYTVDNGPNAGWGNVPKGEGSGGKCTNALNEPGKTYQDSLHHISGKGYYGGHPNPTRGNKNNKFNSKNPQSPVSSSNSIECDYRIPGSQSKALTLFPASTNGLTEYSASNFGGAMQGDLLTAAFNNKIYRLSLKNSGKSLDDKSVLFSNVGKTPLDVTAQADAAIFPGTVWVADFVKKSVYVFEPSDYSDVGNGTVSQVCTGSPAHVDSDKDGYLNGDEISNGTDPCSAADLPADADNDKISDLTDTDDDNDGLKDTSDPFPLDQHNGRNTDLPLSYTWENNGGNPGFLFNLGFTGLMNDGHTDYQSLFEAAEITAGGAAGVLTIDNVPSGSATGNANSQEYAFQFGIDVTPSTPEFTVTTRIQAPFTGTNPSDQQSMGFYIGTGDQDNYIKLVATGKDANGGIEFGIESDSHYANLATESAPIVGSSAVDLYLTVNPKSGTVKAWYSLTRNGTSSPIEPIADKAALPANWLTSATGLAVGIIASSGNDASFTATWDHIDIFNGSISASAVIATETTDENVVDVVDGLVQIEAEHFNSRVKTATHQWILSDKNGASGSAMVATPDSGALFSSNQNSPALEYKVNFAQAGDYSVWVRGSGDTKNNEGKNDSLHVGINGKLGGATAMHDFPADWRWSNEKRDGKSASIYVPSAGIHTVTLWMREDGLTVDRFILSANSRFSPASNTDNATESEADSTVETEDQTEETDESDSDTSTEQDNTEENTTEQDETETENSTANSGIRVVIEAENFKGKSSTATHQWVTVTRSAASNGKAVTTTPDNGTLKGNSQGSPQLAYSVDFSEPGIYYVWARGFGDTDNSGEGKSDSLHVGINGVLNTAEAIQEFPSSWTWSQQRRSGPIAYINVPSAGAHTINVWMREDGFILDKLVLSKQKNDKPLNFESLPADQSGTGEDDVASDEENNETSVDNSESDSDSDSDNNSDGNSGSETNDQSSPEQDQASENNNQYPVVTESNGLISIEAERFQQSIRTETHQWISVKQSDAGAGVSMKTTPDTGTLQKNPNSTPALNYQVEFKKAGSYQVWIRGWGDTLNDEGKSDSVYIGLASAANKAQVVDEFPAGWHWSNHKRYGGRATLTVPSAGVHTVSLWMREDGMNVDQIILTQSQSFSPIASSNEPEDSQSESENSQSESEESQTEPEAEDNDTSAEDEQNAHNSSIVSATTKWKNHTSANGSVIARHEAAGVVFNNKLYVMGGRGNRATSVFDPSKNQWTTLSRPPVQMHHFQPVVWGNKIYVIGAFQGDFPDESPVPTIYSYDPATDKWKSEGSVPQSRRRGSAGVAVYQNRIYLVGGNTEGHRRGAVNWFDVFDPATGQWQNLTPAPTSRDHIQVSVAGGKLVVAAGRQSAYPASTWGNMQSAVDVYDFASGKWLQGNRIPTLRAGAVAVTVGPEVLIIGGETDNVQQARNNVEAFNVQTKQWRTLQPLNTGRHGGAVGLIDNKIHAVTGNTSIGGGRETTSHEILTID